MKPPAFFFFLKIALAIGGKDILLSVMEAWRGVSILKKVSLADGARLEEGEWNLEQSVSK